MVMYTVALTGADIVARQVTLVFTTNEGETWNEYRTDATGVAFMWGPWSDAVQVLVDGNLVSRRAEWQERPADRFTEVALDRALDVVDEARGADPNRRYQPHAS